VTVFERFARDARSAVVEAVEEARRRGDRRVGTDHLVLGMLHGDAATRILGTSLDAAREADARLDAAALAAIGLDVDAEPAGWAVTSRMKRTPFSSGAQDALKVALTHAVSERSRSLEARHLLRALLERQAPDPAAALLAALGVDAAAAIEATTAQTAA
jgi:ATP-dependent Clp protease ATP-binding subunit ClpA